MIHSASMATSGGRNAIMNGQRRTFAERGDEQEPADKR